jgi:cytohesin
VIKALAKHGADVLSPMADGHCPITVAVQCGKAGVIRALVKLGGDVHTPRNSFTPIFVAALHDQVESIHVLAELGVDLNLNVLNFTPLGAAAQSGNVRAIRALIANGGDVHAHQHGGGSVIIVAARNGHVEALQALVELWGDIDVIRASDGMAAVQVAALNGHEKVVKRLYKLGANMKPKDPLISEVVTRLANVIGHAEASQMIETTMEKLTRECEFCGCSSKRVKACSKCMKVRYCSAECQKQDWKEHKKECKAT